MKLTGGGEEVVVGRGRLEVKEHQHNAAYRAGLHPEPAERRRDTLATHTYTHKHTTGEDNSS